MTPLLRKIAEDRTERKAKRRYEHSRAALSSLDDIHSFDVSEVFKLAEEWMKEMWRHPVPPGRLAFLPADRTWIEWKMSWQGSDLQITDYTAFLLESTDDANRASVTNFRYAEAGGTRRGLYVASKAGELWLSRKARPTGVEFVSTPEVLAAIDDLEEMGSDCTLLLYAFLAMINTPKVMHRINHQPDRKLRSKLIGAGAIAGRYELLPWHEIKLDVAPTDDDAEHQSGERLTGERALHYCRAYLWISRGIVCPGHWRGNPALGIRQQRYRVIDSRQDQKQ